MARRSNLDLLGRWLFFVVIPWLILALPRLIMLVWCLAFRSGEEHARAEVNGRDFYRSRAWRQARVRCIRKNKQFFGLLTCEICYRSRETGAKSFHCHHLKSRSNWPELTLDPDNLAMLCESCNMGMSNDYQDLDLNLCRRKLSKQASA